MHVDCQRDDWKQDVEIKWIYFLVKKIISHAEFDQIKKNVPKVMKLNDKTHFSLKIAIETRVSFIGEMYYLLHWSTGARKTRLTRVNVDGWQRASRMYHKITKHMYTMT